MEIRDLTSMLGMRRGTSAFFVVHATAEDTFTSAFASEDENNGVLLRCNPTNDSSKRKDT